MEDIFIGDFNYTATQGLLHCVLSLNNWADSRSGATKLAGIGNNLFGPIPQTIVLGVVDNQFNLFGGYAQKSDLGPALLFLILNCIFLLLHTFIFFFNMSRGHIFGPSILLIVYCIFKILGWALRVVFGQNNTQTQALIASETFLVASAVFLVATNLIFSQRIFTWRHPVGGSRRLFTSVMYGHYIVVVWIIFLAVYSQTVTYGRFLKPETYSKYLTIIRVCAVLVVMYTLTATTLLALSYFFTPTTNDENLYTYQPWWIESFSPFYFVKPHAAQEAELTFMKRTHNHRHAVRVIAATHHHYKVVQGLTNARGDLKHNISLIIISVSTLLLFIEALCRCVSVFSNKQNYDAPPVCAPSLAYVCFGVFESFINLMFLIGRVDLRFYRPDVLPAMVRGVITAEQTNVIPSRIGTPELSDHESDSLPYSDNPFSEARTADEDDSFDLRNYEPPYPADDKIEKFDSDNESEFHF